MAAQSGDDSKPFRAGLLTATRTAASTFFAVASSVMGCTRFSQGASVNGLMVSSIAKSLSTSRRMGIDVVF
jgi:hypothetical protein